MYLEGYGHSAAHAYPVKDWCVAYVDAPESVHTAIRADSEITLIPLWNDASEYLPLTATVSQINTASRQNMATFLENHRVPTGWITGDMTIGRVIKYVVQILMIAQMLEDDYPELNLDTQVSAIPAAQRQRIVQWMNNHGIETQDIDLQWTVRQVLARIIRDYGWSGVMALGTSLL